MFSLHLRFGYSPTFKRGGTESYQAAALRLALRGRRHLIVLDYKKARDFYVFVNEDGDSEPTVANVVGFFQESTKDILKIALDKGVAIHHGIALAGTLSYVPPGCILFEKSLGDEVWGVKTMAFTIAPPALDSLECIHASMLKQHGEEE